MPVRRRQSGQASVEWVALLALVALALGAVLWATGSLRASLALPLELADRFVCAVRLGGECHDRDREVAEA
ncbi:hypothetical protein BH20ACT15_BH20ACT15_15480 [soil metagenome]